MIIYAHTEEKPCTLLVRIKTLTPRKIYLKVTDDSNPNTAYTNRYCTINDEQSLFIRMPLSPKRAVIDVKSEVELSGKEDKGYKVTALKVLPIKRKLSAFDYANPTIKRFIRFAQEFCQKAGYISANGSVYMSDDGKFRIDYLNDIVDEKGESLKTPARISRTEGIIQISKQKFDSYTIPMRMVILCHEFSHYYLNGNMSSEVEADLNALLIYLGLGYPRIDAYNVFTQVFYTAPTEQNKKRMKIIDNFIQNFERKYVDMTYDQENLYKNY